MNNEQGKLQTEAFRRFVKLLYMYLYIGLFLAGAALILSAIIENHLDDQQSAEYRETTATYTGYSEEDYYDHLEKDYVMRYTSHYEFEVNGITYKINGETFEQKSQTISLNPTNFDSTIKIKYDPSNPNKYLLEKKHYKLIILGLGVWIILAFVICKGHITDKKLREHNATYVNP